MIWVICLILLIVGVGISERKLLSEILHNYLKVCFPRNHKDIYKSKLQGLNNEGFFTEEKTWRECSCGRKNKGFFVITNIKVKNTNC